MRPQPDPIAQAMQILQLVTQRRGQQADIRQGDRRLDLQETQLGQQEQDAQMRARQAAQELMLREMAQKQSADQFNRGIGIDQKRMDFEKMKFDAGLQESMLNRAFEQSRFAQTQDYQNAIAEKIRAELSGRIKDPQVMAVEAGQNELVAKMLQEQVQMSPNAIEASRANDQLQAFLQQWLGGKIPPRRAYTPEEQQMMSLSQQ